MNDIKANESNFERGNVKNQYSKGKKENGGKKAKRQNSNNNKLKNKTKKEPLPMKLRALPESFWQQPNKMPPISPGAEYSICCDLEKDQNVLDLGNRRNCEETCQNGTTMTDANTDLLFSLFKKVEERLEITEKSKPRVIKRGRPKKSKTYCESVIKDDDPYLAGGIAESLLNVLPSKSNPDSLQSKIAASQQILAMVSNETNPTAMKRKDDYSQILSDLVVKL